MGRIEGWLTRLFKLEEINGHGRCPTYLYRWTLFQPKWGKGFGVYVHKFVDDDWSFDLHDHPKRFISIGLKGAYIEETPRTPPAWNKFQDELRVTLFTNRQLFTAPWVRSFPAHHIHRLALVRMALGKKLPCWTLVIVLTHVREWGFWHAGSFIPWRTYVRTEGGPADEMKACE
jgi:hypothetical protein